MVMERTVPGRPVDGRAAPRCPTADRHEIANTQCEGAAKESQKWASKQSAWFLCGKSSAEQGLLIHSFIDSINREN